MIPPGSALLPLDPDHPTHPIDTVLDPDPLQVVKSSNTIYFSAKDSIME
jgi:hypothetical protein